MGYNKKKVNNFELLTVEDDGKIYTNVFFYGYNCGKFDGAITCQQFKHGLLVRPTKGKETSANRTYAFFNNNGNEVFRTKRRMNKNETKFIETIKIFEDVDNVSYKKTGEDGNSYTRIFNIATNTEAVEGQISLL